MEPTPTGQRSLRDDCIAEARAIVGEHGLEKLSLREVARRLGVSHGAPYRHFKSRDHLLAEIVASAFADFAAHLDARQRTGIADQDMAAMGRAYLGYALAHPLDYRLMFGTPLPDPHAHPDMMRQARHAFALLRESIRAVRRARNETVDPETLDLDALFVWATMHGMAGITTGDAIRQIGLAPGLDARLPSAALERIGKAIGVR